MKITTVFLDAGGVILDESEQEEFVATIITEILSTVIPGYSLNNYKSDVEESIESYCPETYGYVFWKYVENNITLFNKLYASFQERFQQRKPPLKLMPGFENEVRMISDIFKVGIAGQYGRELLRFLEKNSLLDCFEYRLTQDDFSITKPDPRYFEIILKACGIQPQECIMVGDRIDKDVIPAKQVGMRTILVRTGLHCDQQPRIPSELPDAELKSVIGLAKAVQRVAKQ